MARQTVTLNVRIPRGQYEKLVALVERGEYTSKGEFIRELLRHEFDDFSEFLYEKASRDRAKHVLLEDYGRERGLE